MSEQRIIVLLHVYISSTPSQRLREVNSHCPSSIATCAYLYNVHVIIKKRLFVNFIHWTKFYTFFFFDGLGCTLWRIGDKKTECNTLFVSSCEQTDTAPTYLPRNIGSWEVWDHSLHSKKSEGVQVRMRYATHTHIQTAAHSIKIYTCTKMQSVATVLWPQK